jgi:hypothetical protein
MDQVSQLPVLARVRTCRSPPACAGLHAAPPLSHSRSFGVLVISLDWEKK